jgi:Holliday junction resolvase RusA-like endonuclease
VKVSITIPGVAVPKARPKFARRGNFVHTYTPAKSAAYEKHVVDCAMESLRKQGIISFFDGPLEVDLLVLMPVPKSWSMKKKESVFFDEVMPTSKPDLDNFVKAICDACNRIVWRDDSQIVKMSARKRYCVLGQEPCALLNVATL